MRIKLLGVLLFCAFLAAGVRVMTLTNGEPRMATGTLTWAS
jgi:hypothetical protein